LFRASSQHRFRSTNLKGLLATAGCRLRTPSPDESELNNPNGASYTSGRKIQEIFITFIEKMNGGGKSPNQSLA
jgi:hypothetical protein